jgi:hypothetical protein
MFHRTPEYIDGYRPTECEFSDSSSFDVAETALLIDIVHDDPKPFVAYFRIPAPAVRQFSHCRTSEGVCQKCGSTDWTIGQGCTVCAECGSAFF